MSYLNESGSLHPFEEVVPDALKVNGLSRSSILTSRRRARVTPQSGMNYGSAGAGAGSSQIQTLIADQGGLVDMRSISINYFLNTSGTNTPCADDGHVFSTVQISLNGQLLENIQNAMKVSNIETKLGASMAYYKSAGSLQGLELYNPDLNITTGSGKWGEVVKNVTDLNARQTKAASVQTNGQAGSPRSIPLSSISGLGRMSQYLPISILGELQFIFVTGSAAEVVFNPATAATAAGTGDYSISNFNITYDVVVPDPRYAAVLQNIASNPSEGGLSMPFESTICSAAAAVAQSVTALGETSLIVSRATSHLLRSSVVFMLTAGVQSLGWPSQSCFSHAGVWAFQQRVGSQVYPQIAAQGDSDMFNLALEAYGSVAQEYGSCVNRQTWGISTGATSVTGTPTIYESPQMAAASTAAAGNGSVFGYADSFIPTYGYRVVKGGAEQLDLDGINLSSASGSQLICTFVAAPPAAYTPYVTLVALKFINARGNSVTVQGA